MYSRQLNTNETIKSSVSDIISSEKDNIHSQMYQRALDKFVEASGIDTSSYIINEIKQLQFDEPSYISIVSKNRPYRRKVVDLSAYWDVNYFSRQKRNVLSYLESDDPTSIASLELVDVDYVNDKATLYSRYSGETLKVNIMDIPDDIPVSEDYSLEETFTYKIRNKIYGR